MKHIPYGYKIINAAAVIDELPAEKIRQLYSEYIKSGSMRAAAKKAGINKTHSVIGRLLRNSVYLGDDFYPRIIDETVFNEVQELRKKNAIDQHRVREFQQTSPVILKDYSIGQLEKKFSDPYVQAEYAYSMIKEVNNE